MSGIGGNEPAGYNYSAADTLKAKADNLQGKLHGQQGSRSSAVWTAMREFRGHYSEIFDSNADLATDGRNLIAERLGELSTAVMELKAAAEAEDQRRADARAWEERQRRREENLLYGAAHEVRSFFGFGDDPKPDPAEAPPNFTSQEVTLTGRDVPNSRGQSSTSSAVPADLRHFQQHTGELDDELSTAVAELRGALRDYEAGCNTAWGHLDGQPVLTAMNNWLDHNASDAEWAGLVAEAFEAAGGEGRLTMSDAAIAATLAAAGVDAYRDDLTVEPFEAIGSPPTNGFADDPVNTSTGNFLEPEHDLFFSGGATSLRFSRMYNSQDDRTGVFGFGWSSVLDVRLELDDEGARFIREDGRQITFPRAGDTWGRGVGENYWLTDVLPERLTYVAGLPERVLTVTDNIGSWWAFTPAGLWIAAGTGPGTTVNVVRDETGHITRLRHERGRFIDVEYIDDRVASVHASDGRRIEYLYDDQRRLIEVTSASGTRTYRWNAAGLIDQVVAADGVIEAENTYDDRGRKIRTVTPDGGDLTYGYDDHDRVTTVVTAAGGVIEYEYDTVTDRNPSIIIDPLGGRSQLTWDNGLLTRVVDPEGVSMILDYNTYGELIAVTNANGDTASYVRDEAGRITQTISPSGNTTQLTYSDTGQLLSRQDPDGAIWRFESGAGGRLVAIIDPEGHRTELAHGSNGEIASITDPLGRITSRDYDEFGNLAAVTLPDGARWAYTHDALSRLREITDPTGTAELISYDAAGRPVEFVDANGGLTKAEYDLAGRITAITTPEHRTVRYEYDACGRPAAAIDPTGARTTLTYDADSRVIARTSPTGETSTMQYDAAGRKVYQRDHDGNVPEFTYDDGGRQSAVYTNGQLVSKIVRDGAQRTTTITDGTSDQPAEHRLTYNRLGQLISRVTTRDETTEETRWEYDVDGLRTAMTTPDGTKISYHRDQTGRVTRIKHGTFGEAVYDYDADGRITQARAADQLQTWEYANGFPVVHTHTSAEGVAITRIVRDEAGRITEITGDHGTTTYTYDDGQQLTSAVTDGAESTWSYDPAGRMTAHTTPAGTTSYVYDQAGQLLMIKHPDGVVTTYEYDGQGQRIHERSDRAATKYTWDARGWLRGIFADSVEGTAETKLSVNVFGELTGVNDAHLHWDIAAGVPSLLDVDGTSVFTGPAGVTGINTSWQKPLWRAARGTDQQDPWHTLAAVSAHAGVGLGTDGSLQIAGLEWMGARAYDPHSASFLTQDPLVAPLGASWAANPYSFAGNDPLHALDPHGLAPITDDELQAYADGLQGPLASGLSTAWDGVTGAANSFVGWVEDNAIAIGAGLMVAGGGARDSPCCADTECQHHYSNNI